MAKLLKKLVAAASAAAILASAAAMPAMADVGYNLLSWDYSEDGATADWTLENSAQSAQSINENGMLYLQNERTNGSVVTYKELSNPISGMDVVVEYDIMSYSRGDREKTQFRFGPSGSSSLVVLEFEQGSSSGGGAVTVNGDTEHTATISGDVGYTTALIHVSNTIMTASNLVSTVITYADSGEEIYSGTTGYATADAAETIQRVTAQLGRYNEFYIANFNVYQYLPSNQDTLDAAMTTFNIVETQLGMEKVDNHYVVNRNVTLPAAPTGTEVEWTLSQKAISDTGDNWEPTSFASIDGNTLVINPSEDSANYYVKADAVVSYRDVTAQRSFTFVIEPIDTTQPIVYYDESFDSFSGTLADLSTELSNNTAYEAAYGFTFTSAYRDGNSGIALTAADITDSEGDPTGDRYLNFNITSNATDERMPKIHLSRSTGINVINNLLIELDALFPTTAAQLLVYDSMGSVVTLAAPSESLVNTWLHYQIAVTGSGTYVLVYNGDDIVTIQQLEAALADVARITVPTANVSNLGLNNLYIADVPEFAVTDQQVVDAVVFNLNIDTTQISISESGNAYRVTDDFALPSYPLMDSAVTWSVYQRAKTSGAELEDTTFAAIDGSNLVISPADGIENYDIVLRATATCGEAEATREYTLNILTPQDVVDAAVEDVEIAHADGSPLIATEGVYNVESDLSFATSGADGSVISWSASDSRITSAGGVYPNDSDEDITITATVRFKGASTTKTFTVSLPNAITDYIDPATESLTVASADDETVTYPIDEIGTVSTDLRLPTNITIIDWETFDGSVRIDWTTESSNLKINNGVAEYTVSDFDEHEVTITGTATYVKNGQDVISKEIGSYTYNVQFPESAVDSEDTVYDKYKVRFDAAYDANFSSIPTSTTSNITLPQTGHFGSAITWNSDAPAIISNTGTVSQANATRTVNLTATILKGASSETKTFAITVAGKGNNGGGGGGGGSTSSTGTSSGGGGGGAIASSNGSNTSLTKPTTGQEKVEELIEQREEAENRFSDLGGVSWARDAINGLYDAGIVNGKTDTLFAPNDNVTRAEFAKMLMGVFGLTSDAFTTSSFYDVPSDSWYFQSVESAYNLGIINGVAAGYFDPNANITRQDMAVMVMRAATVSGRTISATTEAKSFNDADSIADYAKEAVTTLQTGGIINGVSDTEFAPLSNATRAQAAQILYSFL